MKKIIKHKIIKMPQANECPLLNNVFGTFYGSRTRFCVYLLKPFSTLKEQSLKPTTVLPTVGKANAK